MVVTRSKFKRMTGYTRDWSIAKERAMFEHNPITIKKKEEERKKRENKK
jgi:hypothetical protein